MQSHCHKINIILSIISFLLLIYSCKSSSEPEIINENQTPEITLEVSGIEIPFGESLQLRLKVENAQSYSAVIDFGDSTYYSFNLLEFTFDTLITHFYDTLGTYHINAEINNGETTIHKEVDISVVPNTSFQLNMSVNKAQIFQDEALIIKIHAFDSTLTRGELHINYDYVIKFENLSPTFDTLITHRFNNSGAKRITSVFYNTEGLNITKDIDIVVDTSPMFDISVDFDKTGMYLGDTLGIIIFARVPNFSRGEIKFIPASGTVTEILEFQENDFKIINDFPTIDTVIYHAFSKFGNHSIYIDFWDTAGKHKRLFRGYWVDSMIKFEIEEYELELGENLIINIQNPTSELVSSSIDFGDGHIEQVNDLHTGETRIVNHTYLEIGEYLISVTSTRRQFSQTLIFFTTPIKIGRYFELNLKVGSKWIYDFSGSYSASLGELSNRNTSGTHEWELFSNTQTTSSYDMRVIRNNQITIDFRNKPDSTYVSIDTLYFTLEILDNNIRYNEIPYGNYGSTFTIPNKTYITSYPITVVAGYPSGTAKFEEIVGLKSYYYSFSELYSSARQSLNLIEFIAP